MFNLEKKITAIINKMIERYKPAFPDTFCNNPEITLKYDLTNKQYEIEKILFSGRDKVWLTNDGIYYSYNYGSGGLLLDFYGQGYEYFLRIQ